MPEENWAAHGGIQACDLCHSRKVKCNRQEPCSNCVLAKADCLRNRHKRAPRPKVRTDDKIQALVQRLSSLEDSVLTRQQTPGIESQEIITPSAAIEDTTASKRPLKRKRTETPLDEGVPDLTSDVDNTQQPANEARSLISKELSTNGFLSTHQRSVLETAISFVDHLSHAPVPTITDRSTFNKTMYSSTELSQGEILHVILGTEVRTVDASTIHFHSLDHIPPSAVERIALALMEGSADEKTLTLYKVIIHFKAAVVLYASQLQGPKSSAVQKHIRQMEYHHLTAALTALDSISFLTTPSLLLVQALITGAMMMQIVGNPASCWELIAHASRTIVALGYHTISETEPKNELDEEILAVIAWCAQFDSCMSLLLLRPRSLPPLHIKVSSLIKADPSNPMSIFEIIAMEMVPVHDKILELTLESTRKKMTTPLLEGVVWLREQMSDIYELMEKERPSYLLDSIMDILLHWKCLEFKYFSTLTSVHRLSPTVTTNPVEREECLQSARKALECVKVIEATGKSLGHFIEGYDPYLAWTMLSYPLCPFFVVFCNVVGTSNARDFQLLQDVTDGISTLVTENKYVNRLHRLCATLLGLCKPLVQPAVTSGDPHMPNREATLSNITETPLLPSSIVHNVADISGADDNGGNFLISSWNDDMMWQLFQSQPSLDWFNADILDPTLDLGLPK
ncbi:putative Zn(II)2Cys6 transcription factor-like protein [Dothidotthia symphoricarpi CBS 119687]|uniref:Putative Zn(II)2Cys6 transcription factor-like protein n=1 Tax=Dothidotthia symphoricarpi CBS 119687 TaxID=1392245 RepID=A0A6A6A2S3_9PLEO|nr:putative Zn(II)2Cys6 transcription factor-like protein [Dothidotthia symphoricarpi CBS 119687]KAF2125846.1 putative Zn(II)2Cys6 transcription factor-like protein [Dothidotthia symphoricarpi CBS 119687]